ncbi:uncharacterized protein [Euphorbia lathyris]|uniref:uncharacterized protein isoform X2 n=1 Tax=Euphorbia lathyris TaxID=212925 RepID=UPI0033144907
MVHGDRMWMYNRLMSNGRVNSQFIKGVAEFVDFAIAKPAFMSGQHIQCPCTRCVNRCFQDPNECKVHLYRYGFIPNYFEWFTQGETYGNSSSTQVDDLVDDYPSDPISPLRQFVYDAAGPELETQRIEEEPNSESRKFFDMLRSLDEELYVGCETTSVLSIVARMLNIKSENNMTERCFDSVLEAMHDTLPPGNKMAKNFYETKKLIRGLGLPVEKIDCCVKGCMLFWRDDSSLLNCKVCGHSRYKMRRSLAKHKPVSFSKMFYFPLTPRLRRLYASKVTVEHMRWHHDHVCDEGAMCHPCDSEAWKHFNNTNQSFAAESRNVRLGLSTDGFQPFGQSGKQYSSWPIILTPYNLPPWMCMKDKYMFLTALVPGPNNPKHNIDVFFQPLIYELLNLWENGVDAYDVSLKQNFTLRAALMWTIGDFPAYSMLSGWSTAGKRACPYCMEKSDAFSLPNGRKTSWFDNHRKFLPMNHRYRRNKTKFRRNCIERRPLPPIKSGQQVLYEIEELGLLKVTEHDSEHVNKLKCGPNCGWKKRSIFWDLPYWKTNMVCHNLDVMHIEKNVFENVFNTVMNIEGKTKDNSKAREDVSLFCNRPELLKDNITGNYPKACYTLSQAQKKIVCAWVKQLKFPDGYVSNLGRCVDNKKAKLFHMKSHDCHVFMQRLLPIALREMLLKNVWEAITELSCFFKNLTAHVIKVDDMAHLEGEIPIILCKLEMIFPPGFFDSMEHLPIHLPYEAKVAGPVQYRWMYPFERYLGRLKKSVKNKARVEGSICNAYLVEEASNFCSYYFEPQVYTRHRKVPRNDDGGDRGGVDKSILMIFSHNGRYSGLARSRWLDEKEHVAFHSYILLNCPEVTPYVEMTSNGGQDGGGDKRTPTGRNNGKQPIRRLVPSTLPPYLQTRRMLSSSSYARGTLPSQVHEASASQVNEASPSHVQEASPSPTPSSTDRTLPSSTQEPTTPPTSLHGPITSPTNPLQAQPSTEDSNIAGGSTQSSTTAPRNYGPRFIYSHLASVVTSIFQEYPQPVAYNAGMIPIAIIDKYFKEFRVFKFIYFHLRFRNRFLIDSLNLCRNLVFGTNPNIRMTQ